jgi:hypothetical protein
MRRLQDWPERLSDYIEQCRDRPFEWCVHDCATMALGAVEAMTGQRLMETPYSDARGAAAYMASPGIAATVDGLLEAEPTAFAQRGDVVLLLIDGRQTLGVCIGGEAAAPGEAGLVTVPMRLATAAWRV